MRQTTNHSKQSNELAQEATYCWHWIPILQMNRKDEHQQLWLFRQPLVDHPNLFVWLGLALLLVLLLRLLVQQRSIRLFLLLLERELDFLLERELERCHDLVRELVEDHDLKCPECRLG